MFQLVLLMGTLVPIGWIITVSLHVEFPEQIMKEIVVFTGFVHPKGSRIIGPFFQHMLASPYRLKTFVWDNKKNILGPRKPGLSPGLRPLGTQ